MKNRVGELWELNMFAPSLMGAQAALVYVISSDLAEGMHRLLVIDGGVTGWLAGQLRTYGELQDGFGGKRVA